ncbi:E3 ubiquitin-protein ligase rnf146-like isoform X2 [Sitodiplosis mosellana]|uniref:E3 ubiquitin-protein ligase rnf146-like isoform X2 n=1 Tax=Sitodiplosis mosellana TaxID=263140 RepID=UPI002443B362|nr:E3 ubiquitin-protein ligase rnf146-like isoform X2 [Sitodiplosis mosellana]XP_055310397.1 E3 ubiquitin-protein ligase rnf146-like isoform X2 [Sitodiplosis mosellana]
MANASIYEVDEKGQQHTADDKSNTNEFEMMECPVCLQLCVHPSKLPCGHIFCFLCVKGLKNRRCAMCRAEFSSEFLDHPQLLLPISTTPTLTSSSEQNKYQWFYKGHNGWWQYDERTCQEIEDAYKKAQKQCTILVAGNLYIVDFDQMLQKRQTDPSRKRQVKRDLATIPIKGVAGLRLWNTGDPNLNVNSSTENVNSNSNLVATIAATEAAIRIASDIIDSTLAHVDDHTADHQNDNSGRSLPLDSVVVTSGGAPNEQTSEYNIANSESSSSSSINNTSRDMLDEIEETFNITNPSSINTSFRPTSDFFSSTLNEFRNLTLNNIADDSSDDNGDDYDDDDDDDDDDDTAHFEDNRHFVESQSLQN